MDNEQEGQRDLKCYVFFVSLHFKMFIVKYGISLLLPLRQTSFY